MKQKNLSEKEYFKQACLNDDLQTFYKSYIDAKRDRIQFFNERSDGRLTHKYWVPSKRCCVSGDLLTEEEFDVRVGYWTPFSWQPIKKSLLNEIKKQEAYECQKIDCNCNDCKFFERVLENKGRCKKFEKDIIVTPNVCSPQNLNCFQHRQD